MRKVGRTGVLGLVLLLGGSAAALAAADIANGERLARRWCAECHVIEPGQKSAVADVPAFSAIAADPSRTADSLATLLAVPDRAHSRMQNLNLSRNEITDLVGYILAQKR